MAEQSAGQLDTVLQLDGLGAYLILLELHAQQVVAGHQTVIIGGRRHIGYRIEQVRCFADGSTFLHQSGNEPIGLCHLLQHIAFGYLLFEFGGVDT